MIRYKKGDIVTCCVTGVEKYGIFVSIDEYSTGLIHISEISDSYVRNPSDYANVGELIRAEVIENDEEINSYKYKLSIKNIDYRINKPKKNFIHETFSGFSTLENMLPKWIYSKEKQLLSKK